MDRFKEVFAELPGRARNYDCELKVREHTPFVQRSYPVPYSKRRAVQILLPFRLNTSVASFIKCLDEMLQPKNLEFLTVYIDDVLIASRTFS